MSIQLDQSSIDQGPIKQDPALQAIGEITDVNVSIRKYIRDNYPWFIPLVIVSAILELLLIAGMVLTTHAEGIVFLIIVVLMPALIVYSHVRNKLQDVFMEQFAAANHFSFQQTAELTSLDGFLFSLGHSHFSRDIVTGQFQNLPLLLFNHSYTIGSGKNSRTYFYTIFRLEYPTSLPHILLQDTGPNFGQGLPFVSVFSGAEKLQLEGDFNKFFTLWCKKGFETEALEIFSPDFMAKMQDIWKNFHLEFVNNHVYIYSHGIIGNKADLTSMYSLVQYLDQKIEPLTVRMRNDVTEMNALVGH